LSLNDDNAMCFVGSVTEMADGEELRRGTDPTPLPYFAAAVL
jgi:hypothetical protein